MQIYAGGVIVESPWSFWVWLLCKTLRIYDWRYWRMAKSFEDAFPTDRTVYRSCTRCGLKQCASERHAGPQIWHSRL